MPSQAQKVAESLLAKYIRIALATFRKFDDSFGYAVAGVKTAPVSLDSRTSHFECNAHDPRGLRVTLFAAEKWCDSHDPQPLASKPASRASEKARAYLRASYRPA